MKQLIHIIKLFFSAQYAREHCIVNGTHRVQLMEMGMDKYCPNCGSRTP